MQLIGIRRALRAGTTEAFVDAWELTLNTLLRTSLIERTMDRLLSEGVVERVVALTIEHPATERVINRLVESPGLERLLLGIGNSRLVDQMIDRILASEQLDRIVSQIAESEEVRNALRQQSVGMADEVTDEIRSRTIAADAVLERFARSVIRRGRASTDNPPLDPDA